jgi:hypothetical protein
MTSILHHDYILLAYVREHVFVVFHIVLDLELERALPYQHQDRSLIVLSLLLKPV